MKRCFVMFILLILMLLCASLLENLSKSSSESDLVFDEFASETQVFREE